MNESFGAFVASCGSKSKTTLSLYGQYLRRFESYCQEQGLDWKSCGAADLEAYHQSLLWASLPSGRMYSPNTIDLALRVLRGFYRWAITQGLVFLDPTADWVMPRPAQPQQPTLSRHQALALLNLPDLSTATGQRDQLLLELTYTVGLSFMDSRTQGLDWEARLEPVRASWERYLHDGRRRLARPDTPPVLLLSARGLPFRSEAALRAIFSVYRQKLGLSFNLSPHLLRRSAREHLERLSRRHSQSLSGRGILER